MPKSQTIQKRGFLGWIFLILFLAFNLYMGVVIIFNIWQNRGAISNMQLIVLGAIIAAWCVGSIILGLFSDSHARFQNGNDRIRVSPAVPKPSAWLSRSR
jgi:hypothetical protein